MIALQTLDAGILSATNSQSGGDVKKGALALGAPSDGPMGTKAVGAQDGATKPKTKFEDVLKSLAGKDAHLDPAHHKPTSTKDTKGQKHVPELSAKSDLLTRKGELKLLGLGRKIDDDPEQVTPPGDLAAVLQAVEPEDLEELAAVSKNARTPGIKNGKDVLAGTIAGAATTKTGVEKGDGARKTNADHGSATKHAASKGHAKLEVLDFRKGTGPAAAGKTLAPSHEGLKEIDQRMAHGTGKSGASPEAVAAQSGKGHDNRHASRAQSDLSADAIPGTESRVAPPVQADAKMELPATANAHTLRAHLRDEGNAAIVEKAQFLLKDGDNGEIRLILKPERLGEVRIRLELHDNRIAGRIIVENSSVRDAFQQNLGDLSRAFRENGFDAASLDVSVGDDRGQTADEGGSGRRHPGERAMDAAGVSADENYGFSDRLVNLIA